MSRDKNRSAGARRRMRKARAIRKRAEAIFGKSSASVHEKEAPKPTFQTESTHEVKREPAILKEDIAKLGDLLGSRLPHSKICILSAAGYTKIDEVASRMKVGRFKVKGIGPISERAIKELLRERGVSIP